MVKPTFGLLGAGCLDLAVALARAGHRVVLSVPDQHDRTRLADILSTRHLEAPGAVQISAQCRDVLVWDGLEAGPNRPCLSLDWAAKKAPDLVPTRLWFNAGGAARLERLGDDPLQLCERLAEALGASVIDIPYGQVPFSLIAQAAFDGLLERLCLAGPTPVEIDDALQQTGHAIRPFLKRDQDGNDRRQAERLACAARVSLCFPADLPLFPRALAEGRLGRSVGVGWYRYPGGGGPVEDPLIEDMAAEEAHFAGLAFDSTRDANWIITETEKGLHRIRDDLIARGVGLKQAETLVRDVTGAPVL